MNRFTAVARLELPERPPQASDRMIPAPIDASCKTRRPGSNTKRARTCGSGCIWPRGLRERYGVSGPTLWRWERTGKLPDRDVFIGGRAVGWRPETIERAERGEAASIQP
jgi:predicted DNA-binding transcriptional regulator AlpA